jgi:SRSO17 transposase
LFTQDSIDTLLEVQDLDRLNLYLPLINKNEVVKSPQNIVFGAIDYKNQIETLLTQSNKQNSIFYTNNALGLKLKEYVENSNQNVKATTVINKHTNVFKRIVKNKKLRNSSLFLNTSIIKSSIILSQLRAHEANVYKILSTQLNYTPLVISLTQYPDRKNFVIANSIERTDLKLQESLALFDADIEYNWVNYATLIGMDYLYKKDDSGLFPSKIEDNQVKYNVRLYKNTRHGFKKLSSK